jgi:hypothetical protein
MSRFQFKATVMQETVFAVILHSETGNFKDINHVVSSFTCNGYLTAIGVANKHAGTPAVW